LKHEGVTPEALTIASRPSRARGLKQYGFLLSYLLR